jgi:hypothetical protein
LRCRDIIAGTHATLERDLNVSKQSLM